jgi:rhodanese-related sulfurtransferase
VGQAHATFNNYIFLDAREIEEYNISHIPQARYIGYNSFDIKSIKDIPKNKQIIVYCSIGYRSEKIGEKLMKAGYLHVYNLYGSIFEWANRSLPLLDKSGKRTNLVHTYNKQWSKFVTNPKITKRY